MKTKGLIALIVSGVIVIGAGIYCAKSFERIGQGEVGVVYTVSDGVQEETLSPGWHFVGPFAKVYNYPVAQQQLVLSNNPADFNKKELDQDTHVDAPANGGTVKMNVVVNYNFMPEKITSLFGRFNGMDGEVLVQSRIKNSIIAYIKEVTSKFTVMDIYSDSREEVSAAITEHLNNKLNNEYGINVSSALIIDVQLDDTLMAKVQAKEQAKQDAEKAELDKQTAIAQGEANKAQAEADSEVKRIQAEAKAEQTRIAAEAESDANKMINESISEELIKMKEAEARLEHGWVTVQANDPNVVVDEK